MSESRTAGAIEAIRSMIASGALCPGDRLPREAELAEQLAVSRGSLREAVRALTFMGVLRARQGDGTYVTDLDGASLLDTLGFVVDLASEQTLLEFFQLRRLLEPATAALAAAQASADDLDAIEACLDAMVEAASSGDRDGFIDADLGFHHTVADVVGNTVLSSLLRALGLRSIRVHQWRARVDGGAIERSIADHHAILAAIQARDPEAARAAATAHLLGGESWVRRVVADPADADSVLPTDLDRETA